MSQVYFSSNHIVEILLPKGGKNINPKDVIEVIVKYQDNIEHINVD